MTISTGGITEILKKYEELASYYKSVLSFAPHGKLYLQINPHGSNQLIHYRREGNASIRRGVNTDTEMLKSLAQKEFAEKALKIIENNIASLRDAMEAQIPFDTDDILKSMNKAYSLLPEEYFFDRKSLIITERVDDDLAARIKKHEEWWKKPYKEYWGYPEHKTRTTSRGEKVRSISEMLIAEALYKYSIPFHYEEELKVDGKTYAPDFTFEGADYSKFYLDYFGMMDNEKYAKRNFLKLDDYYDIGLIPGNNLIVAFDCTGIMNASVIEGIIKNEVIPRL